MNFTRIFVAAMAVVVATGTAQAEGCAPPDGVAVPRVELLNQMVLDQNFLGFAKSVEADTGQNVRGGLNSIATTFEAGFDGCTTLVQRRDVGGMVQSVVMYHGKAGPLFGFFRTAEIKGEVKLVTFSLNTSSEEILEKLR